MSTRAKPFSRPVLATFSVLAGAQVLVAGAALADVVGERIAAFLVLVVAAVQAGMSFYVSNLVTPNQRVVARRSNGKVVSGEGAEIRPGIPVAVHTVLVEGNPDEPQ